MYVRDKAEYMFGKFMGNGKLEGVVDRLNGCAAVPRDLDRAGRVGELVQQESHRNHKGKCRVQSLEKYNPMH